MNRAIERAFASSDSESSIADLLACMGEVLTNLFDAEHLVPEELARFKTLLSRAIAHQLGGSEGTVRFNKPGGGTAEMKLRAFLLYICEKHRLYLSMIGQRKAPFPQDSAARGVPGAHDRFTDDDGSAILGTGAVGERGVFPCSRQGR